MASLSGGDLLSPVPAAQIVRVAVARGSLARLRANDPLDADSAGQSPKPGETEVRSVIVTSGPNYGPRFGIGVLAVAVVAIFALIINKFITDPNYASSVSVPQPVEGLTIFAVFFVAALAIERLLEPLANALNIQKRKEDEATAAVAEAKSAATNATAADTADAAKNVAADVQQKAVEATKKIEAASDWTFYRTTAFWAFATIVAIWASAALHLYFLRAVGIANANHGLEVLATGLIIGAGTKPLHDFITLISTKKDQQKDQ